MMDWTDRHCRFFHRGLTRRARLYTEMVTAEAVIRGDRERLIGFDAEEHPLALQLGGSEPERLAEAARIGADFGYDEINLNVGCPSDRVQSGTFGACLMREPALVGDCVAAMKAAVAIPVTVKCRIGVDEQDPEEALDRLADAVLAAGADAIWVHARKAWLSGLSPKENRDVPPLDYDRVYRLKARLTDVFVGINGGIRDLDAARAHLATCRRRDARPRRLPESGDPRRDRWAARRRHRAAVARSGGGAHDPLCREALRRGRPRLQRHAPYDRAFPGAAGRAPLAADPDGGGDAAWGGTGGDPARACRGR